MIKRTSLAAPVKFLHRNYPSELCSVASASSDYSMLKTIGSPIIWLKTARRKRCKRVRLFGSLEKLTPS